MTDQTRSIAVLGVGAIGSFLTELIVRCVDSATVTFYDDDRVEIHNLANQNYTYNDIGVLKVIALQKRLFTIAHANTAVNGIKITITDKSIQHALKPNVPDVVVDCMDNMKSRMIANDYCVLNSIPCLHVGMSNVHAGVRWATNNYQVVDVDEDAACDRGAAHVLTNIIWTATLGVDVVLKYINEGVMTEKMVYFDKQE